MSGLEKTIGYSFRDGSLLTLALSHPSLNRDGLASNQRLEFLGDAVLQLCASVRLYAQNPEMHEGWLSRRRALLVQEQSLRQAAEKIGLGAYLLMGPGEESTGGRDKPSILADALEALLGAIFLDGGLPEAERFVAAFVLSLEIPPETRDFKTDFQEHTQRKSGITPVYRIVSEDGPAHDRSFTAEVFLQDALAGQGSGQSKKAAEQAAAQDALERDLKSK
ncbi:MAG: ribonuclease III [Christensenellaceae bacterium]|jgi:ribonuclease-3|nr:ribonuclease III [Christensenellaceae bacterium]